MNTPNTGKTINISGRHPLDTSLILTVILISFQEGRVGALLSHHHKNNSSAYFFDSFLSSIEYKALVQAAFPVYRHSTLHSTSLTEAGVTEEGKTDEEEKEVKKPGRTGGK